MKYTDNSVKRKAVFDVLIENKEIQPSNEMSVSEIFNILLYDEKHLKEIGIWLLCEG